MPAAPQRFDPIITERQSLGVSGVRKGGRGGLSRDQVVGKRAGSGGPWPGPGGARSPARRDAAGREYDQSGRLGAAMRASRCHSILLAGGLYMSPLHLIVVVKCRCDSSPGIARRRRSRCRNLGNCFLCKFSCDQSSKTAWADRQIMYDPENWTQTRPLDKSLPLTTLNIEPYFSRTSQTLSRIILGPLHKRNEFEETIATNSSSDPNSPIFRYRSGP